MAAMVQYIQVRRVNRSAERCPDLLATCRKFFTVVMTFNVTALILAIAGVWDYPRRYTGAMVLGNLYTAILIRNELFGRFLYLVVNTLFAKVSSFD